MQNILMKTQDEQNQQLLLKSDTILNMFHALMGRFQLELFIFITYFSTVVPITSYVFFPVGLLSLTQHFQQVL